MYRPHFEQLTRDSEALRYMGLQSIEKMRRWDNRACLDGVVQNLEAIGFNIRHSQNDTTPDDL